LITPGHVGVGEPATPTKQIDNVALQQPDTTAVERQLIGIGDPEDWSKIAKVTDADPDANALGLVVRPIGGATDPDYDSGLLDVPDVETAVTAITTQVRTLLFINDATQLRHITLKDGDGNVYFSAKSMQAKEVLPLNFGGASLSNGIKVNVNSGQTGVRVQIVGRQ
jgi:hypothetical protein